MDIEYDLTPSDWAAFAHHAANHTSAGRRRKWMLAAVFLAAALVFSGKNLDALLTGRARNVETAAVAVAAVSLMLPVGLIALLFYTHSRAAIDRRFAGLLARGFRLGPMGRKRLAISPEGVRLTGDGQESFLAWRHVVRIDEAPGYLFLYEIFLPRGGAAFIVPRRAFDSDADFDRFWRLADGYRRAAEAPA
jgi:hypothetical protein